MRYENERYVMVAVGLVIYAIVASLYFFADRRADRAEQYSEHLARELRLCEEGKR